jgi:hypothetical protein
MSEANFCPVPFTHLHVQTGRFSTCCAAWVDGSRFVLDHYQNPWDIWNHQNFIELRQAVLDKDWKRFCSGCPNLARGPQWRRDERRDGEDVVMRKPPQNLSIADNSTCQLHCVTCRPHRVFEEDKRRVIEWMLDGFGGGVQIVSLSHSGDPFANPSHRHWLQTVGKGGPDIHLFTNGLLLPQYWHTLNCRVTLIFFSIDAATGPTYERLRRGGRWEDLQRAMRFCADIRRRGEILHLQYNMVVQAENFREIVPFAEMCIEHAADQIQFTMMAPWPHMPTAWFRERNLSNPGHPNYAEFCEILDDPRLRHPAVDAGLIAREVHPIFADADPQARNIFL